MSTKTLFAFSLAAMVSFAACGSGRVVKDEPRPADTPVKPAAPDAFRDFTGDKVDAGKPFKLLKNPKAVKGAEVVVKLLKVKWTV